MRQATRERYREEENFDDDLVEEDSEGNKFVERILKADERRFREDDSGAFTTPDRPTIALSNVTPSLPHSLGIPPPAQTHPRAAPSPPATTSHLPATQHDVGGMVPVQTDPFDPTRRLDFSICDRNDEHHSLAAVSTNVLVENNQTLSRPIEEDGSATASTPLDRVISYWCSLFEQIPDYTSRRQWMAQVERMYLSMKTNRSIGLPKKVELLM
ncbi:hypothetical protein PI124_g8048 [Phytophthora idaei]|nr:hypothetical protein PI125_g9514 [Phytophthora idaei]KAG3147922.1 hypothetical protein PI126_g12671 [Phytophthora idaei]KAG3247244.1 hypothetical protein PI124_g8048 [Phytophthora idaei]